jgi:hypothetical protein
MAGEWCFVCEHAGGLCTCDAPTVVRRQRRSEPVVVEITPLFVLETARDLRGRGVLVPRIPESGEHVESVAVAVPSVKRGRSR